MLSVNCTTPEEGWAIFFRIIILNLTLINLQAAAYDTITEIGSSVSDKFTQRWNNRLSEFIANLDMVISKMEEHGHQETAVQMQQIIDLIQSVKTEFMKIETSDLIMAKLRELDPYKAKYDEKLFTTR